MMTPPINRRAFLKCSAAAAGGALASGAWAATPQKSLLAYVGTFSSPLRDMLPTQVDLPAGNGRGIHWFTVNRATGALSPAGIFAQPSSPNCLVINSAGNRLYSTNETERGADKSGTVSAYAINRSDGSLTVLNSTSSGGAGPTDICLHSSGKFLFVANYFGGSVAVLPVLPDGRLGAATDIKPDTGKPGPARATHAPPGSFAVSGHDILHAHMIRPDPAGRFVFHTNLAMDQIRVWEFDAAAGALRRHDPGIVPLPPGDGPRRFFFHPNGRWFYSLQEEASTICLFDYDAERGVLAPRQTVSSLPPGFAGSSFASEIKLSPDGRHVYAANRLHDSICWFTVGHDGSLTFADKAWTRGDYPRSFNFDPEGKFLYSCNQRADNVTSFRIHRSGVLEFTGYYTPVGNPSSIVFLDLAAGG